MVFNFTFRKEKKKNCEHWLKWQEINEQESEVPRKKMEDLRKKSRKEIKLEKSGMIKELENEILLELHLGNSKFLPKFQITVPQ